VLLQECRTDVSLNTESYGRLRSQRPAFALVGPCSPHGCRLSTGFFIHRREPPRASLAILPGRLSLSGGRDRWRPSPVGALVRSFHFQATNHRPHAGGSDAASIRMFRSPGQSSWSGVDGVRLPINSQRFLEATSLQSDIALQQPLLTAAFCIGF